MKFWTIWTMPAMSMRERMNRTGEWTLFTVAARMPKRLAYYVLIVHGGRQIKSDEVVPEVRFMDVAERLGNDVMGDAR